MVLIADGYDTVKQNQDQQSATSTKALLYSPASAETETEYIAQCVTKYVIGNCVIAAAANVVHGNQKRTGI